MEMEMEMEMGMDPGLRRDDGRRTDDALGMHFTSSFPRKRESMNPGDGSRPSPG
jgi:hypothetical protein